MRICGTWAATGLASNHQAWYLNSFVQGHIQILS